jgi:hypothetical protein
MGAGIEPALAPVVADFAADGFHGRAFEQSGEVFPDVPQSG